MFLRIAPCLALLGALALAVPLGARAAPDQEALLREKIRAATARFRDLRMDVRIAYSNQTELAAIGKDYGKAYEFKNSKLIFKAPDKFKMTAVAGIVNVSYIITGNIKRIRAGLLKKTEDITDEPHKKQTPLDVGVVSDSIWRQFDVTAVRTEGTTAQPVYVLTLALSNSRQKKQYIWVDGRDFRLLKREKHEADGSLRARYVYSKHREYKDAVWVPGEQRVFNQKGKLAGTSVYTNIQVNTGVTDGVFQ